MKEYVCECGKKIKGRRICGNCYKKSKGLVHWEVWLTSDEAKAVDELVAKYESKKEFLLKGDK